MIVYCGFFQHYFPLSVWPSVRRRDNSHFSNVYRHICNTRINRGPIGTCIYENHFILAVFAYQTTPNLIRLLHSSPPWPDHPDHPDHPEHPNYSDINGTVNSCCQVQKVKQRCRAIFILNFLYTDNSWLFDRQDWWMSSFRFVGASRGLK